MTPAEQEFIALWTQGLEIATSAQRLGIPKGTVQSRALRLQARGLIQPRPKGGAYPRQKALARLTDTGAVQRLDRLEDEVQGLRLILQSVVDRLDYTPV
jgi:DNA-binding IclR family transcriptional regulator